MKQKTQHLNNTTKNAHMKTTKTQRKHPPTTHIEQQNTKI